MSYSWLEQLEPLVHELAAMVGSERQLVAVTVSVPSDAPLEAAERLVEGVLAHAGYKSVQVTARPGGSLQVLAAEFSR